MEPRSFLRALFDAAIDVAQPKAEWFSDLEAPRGRTIVVGAGKASSSMARALESSWEHPIGGLVVTRYGYGVRCERIEVAEAAHPLPDLAGVHASRRILSLVSQLSENDLVVALISGGGSALLTLPAPGITLEDKQGISDLLLRSGASIREINTVRRHLSAVKGGRLLAACGPASVVTYVLSDVAGDDPTVVASGPTIPDNTTKAEARETLSRYGIPVPESVRRHLQLPEAPPVASKDAQVRLVGSSRLSLESAARRAESLGIRAHILSDAVEGEAREVGKVQAALARQVSETGEPFRPPCVLLSGGETTVTVRGRGRGGPNVEFLTSLAQALEGRPGIYALAADTDGVDGTDETAGAFLDPSTFDRAGAGLETALEENDTHTLFASLGDALITGPTLTNVNDFRAILVT